MICQSHEIGCVWKPGFLKSGPNYTNLNYLIILHVSIYLSGTYAKKI